MGATPFLADTVRAVTETKRDVSSLAVFICGGAPIPQPLAEETRRRLPCHLAPGWGMTELGLYATYTDADASFEVLSRTIGRPHVAFDIRIADAEGKMVPSGGEGEIQARGDWLFAGYFRDPEATAEAYTADGWFRTGDVVKVWPDGNLEIVGRTKEMFISGGFNIYPREIEELLLEHVAEAAVVGLPDDVRGEVPVAYIVGDFDAAELERICREQLASFKVPRRFVRVDSIPRTALGKVQKHLLPRD